MKIQEPQSAGDRLSWGHVLGPKIQQKKPETGNFKSKISKSYIDAIIQKCLMYYENSATLNNLFIAKLSRYP